MKKLVSIILLLCLVCLSCTVYASEPPATENASVNIKFETVKDENKITIKISTGKFDGVKEGSVMSASMSLVYDDANISKVSGKTTDNWKITISDETKMVLLENDKANSNTQFVELTFELRDVKEEKTGTVSIKDFNISDGNLLDEKYPRVAARVREHLETGWEPTLALLEQAMGEGVIRRVSLPVLQRMISASIEDFLADRTLDAQGISYTDALDEMISILLEGLLVR